LAVKELRKHHGSEIGGSVVAAVLYSLRSEHEN